MLVHGDAEELGAALVLPDGDQGAAERRAQQERHQCNANGEHEQHEVVEQRAVALDVDGPWADRKRLARKPAQPVIAAGEIVPAIGDIIKDLTERNRNHSEIYAAAPAEQKP